MEPRPGWHLLPVRKLLAQGSSRIETDSSWGPEEDRPKKNTEVETKELQS